MPALVRVEHITKRYANGTLAVDDVSFCIKEGETFSLLGPNGAGKTTLISMLSGILTPTDGDAFIGQHSIRHAPLAAKRLIGIVPQDVALYPTLTARQNLTFWGGMYDVHGATLRARVEEALDIVGLREHADERVETFSGGMKRRLNIAAGLLHHPRLLLLDEPTVGIDPQSRRRILDTVKQFNAEGMTVLYTTHYMEEAEELSHRIAIMDHGRIIALGTLEELRHLVGEHESVRMTLRETVNVEAVCEHLRHIADIRHITSTDHQVVALVPDAAAALPAIVTHLSRYHVPISTIEIERPDLEAVFLHLTGRSLRD
nr:ABC transporter ATP-binding protein [Ardenticatena sp.]